jgi:hypothetical protein
MLTGLATTLLPTALASKGLFGSAFVAGLHIETMFFDFLDDVFLLHFALESAQGVLDRLSVLDPDFGQNLLNLPRYNLRRETACRFGGLLNEDPCPRIPGT